MNKTRNKQKNKTQVRQQFSLQFKLTLISLSTTLHIVIGLHNLHGS